MLNREEMEKVIRSGGSVLYQGSIISRIEALPSAAELAKGDPDKEAQAANDLQVQINQLQTQLAQLQGESVVVVTGDADADATANAVIEHLKPKRSPKKAEEGEQE